MRPMDRSRSSSWHDKVDETHVWQRATLRGPRVKLKQLMSAPKGNSEDPWEPRSNLIRGLKKKIGGCLEDSWEARMSLKNTLEV